MKRYITFILLAVLAVCANAQIRVSGTVTDGSGEPLIGASVTTAGAGVTTDLDGRYTITADSKGSLTFSYVGFKSQTLKIDGRTTIDVVLSEST